MRLFFAIECDQITVNEIISPSGLTTHQAKTKDVNMMRLMYNTVHCCGNFQLVGKRFHELRMHLKIAFVLFTVKAL